MPISPRDLFLPTHLPSHPRDLQRALIRLRPRVRKEHLQLVLFARSLAGCKPAPALLGREIHQLLSKQRRPLVMVYIARMDQFARLLVQDLDRMLSCEQAIYFHRRKEIKGTRKASYDRERSTVPVHE